MEKGDWAEARREYRRGYQCGWLHALSWLYYGVFEANLSFEFVRRALERHGRDALVDLERADFPPAPSLADGPPLAKGMRRRFLVLQRDGFRCRLCGRSAAEGAVLEVDHRVAKAAGGTDSFDNLWTLCRACNQGKGDLPV